MTKLTLLTIVILRDKNRADFPLFHQTPNMQSEGVMPLSESSCTPVKFVKHVLPPQFESFHVIPNPNLLSGELELCNCFLLVLSRDITADH